MPRPSPIQLASNRLQPVTTTVQEAANESGIFTQRATHHHTTPQSVEDELEESETEGLIGTLEIIGPSLETFAQLPLPSARASIIPCLSEYLVRFNMLASRVEWGDAALRFQFYDGLPE